MNTADRYDGARGRRMGRRRMGPALVAAACASLLLAGCSPGTDDAPATTGADTSDGVASTASPPLTTAPGDTTAVTSGAASPDAAATETPAGSPIKTFDFAGAEWTDSWTHQTVTLADGSATVEGDVTADLRLSGEPEYLDLDGDGDEDALVGLSGEESDHFWDYTYAWLWDEEAQQPVQVLPALTDDARCGNATQDISVEPDGRIRVDYRRRADGTPCAEPPTEEASRVVELTGSWAYQVEPVRSALGECGEPASDLLTPAEAQLPGDGLHAAPSEDAPYLVEWDGIDRVALPNEAVRDAGLPPGWQRVLYTTPGQSPDDMTRQCGYVLTS